MVNPNSRLIGTKKCTKCKYDKPLTSFSDDKSECKLCLRINTCTMCGKKAEKCVTRRVKRGSKTKTLTFHEMCIPAYEESLIDRNAARARQSKAVRNPVGGFR